ncbi:MAG: AMP-binding protein [Pseudomonadota bacterium]
MTVFRSQWADIDPSDRTITERLFDGLAGRADSLAMFDGATGRGLTGRAIMDGIKTLAGGLTERGYGAGATVALMAPNCPEYCIALNGPLWAGGTVTTLNPTYTPAEARHQLLDAGADLLIVTPDGLDTAQAAIAGTRVREIAVIGGAGGMLSLEALMGPAMEAQVPVDLDTHIALLPYSSGTTGLPKGVMLSHRNVATNIAQSLPFLQIAPGDVTPAFLPFFHIYGMVCLLHGFLIAGGRIACMPRFDLELFLSLIQTHKVPSLWIVPPVAIALAKHPIVDSYDLSSVNFVNCAAAPLADEVGDALAARLGCAVSQGYGMTELSPVASATRKDALCPGSVGQLIPNTECMIVDVASGTPRGVGEEGEIWIRGPQVMMGYLNRADATAETVDAQGWLHTGDVGLMDADGYLFIRDRVKELIKYKAFQVAPAELEAALLGLSEIADAAVIGKPDEEAGEVPVAFVVPAQGVDIDPDAVMRAATADLAHYKRLHGLTVVDAIPKSAAGKILRRVLRQQIG